jgi:hypothetical protein
MRPIALLLAIAAFLAVIAAAVTTAGADPARPTLALTLGKQSLEGTPLSWDDRSMCLLSRDGRIYEFEIDQARDSRKTSPTFRGYSASEMRDRLARELGKNFEVTHTGHYLVAHAKGTKKDWAPRFEEMYKQFTHYFTIRGFRPLEPEFPLVAIVWPTRADFERYAAAEGSSIGAGYLGYYSSKSNRVTLFDQRDSGGDAADTIDTIVHEAAHQTAYNTGIHRRFADVPRWLVEGLGTMFEAKGVWNSRSFPNRKDRINAGRFRDFEAMKAGRPAGLLAEVVSSDRLFETDPGRGYAEAWALSFYLSEKMPRQYCDYLELTASRPVFEKYPSAERLKDFTKVFGRDLKLVESQFLRFMDELK